MRWGESLLLLPLVACAAGRGRSGSVGPGLSAGGPPALAGPDRATFRDRTGQPGRALRDEVASQQRARGDLDADPSATSVSYMTWFKSARATRTKRPARPGSPICSSI